MTEQQVSSDTVYRMMYGAITRAATIVPEDAREALVASQAMEKSALARNQIRSMLTNIAAQEKSSASACADTGFPLFYVRIGDAVRIEGGLSTLQQGAERAVRQATREDKICATMVHPLTRANPGDNVGPFFPSVEIRPVPSLEGLEIIAVPKGGGSETFGALFRMLTAADGQGGILRFALDSITQAAYAGKACPPNIIGIGVGGTADLCMRLAKEAAVLRPVGSRHPDPDIAQLEQDILEAANSLGIGPMGTGGVTTVLDVHVECALTFGAALPVAFNAQCALARRGVARLFADGRLDFGDRPEN